jgi:hypothetical protein
MRTALKKLLRKLLKTGFSGFLKKCQRMCPDIEANREKDGTQSLNQAVKRHRVDFEECLLLRVELPFMPDACLPFEARPSLLHIYFPDRLTGLNQF